MPKRLKAEYDKRGKKKLTARNKFMMGLVE
jgi:hypothetical protein